MAGIEAVWLGQKRLVSPLGGDIQCILMASVAVAQVCGLLDFGGFLGGCTKFLASTNREEALPRHARRKRT